MNRILIIEDNADLLELYQISLEQTFHATDYCLTCAVTGEKGLAEFAQARSDGKPFDLVITDLQIDEKQTGVGVIKEIRSSTPDVPIVIATGNKSPHINLVAEQMGVQHVWIKPINGFAEKVGEILGMKANHPTSDLPRGKVQRFVWALNHAKQGSLILMLLLMLIALQIRSTIMSPILYANQANLVDKISSIEGKIDAALSDNVPSNSFKAKLAKPRDSVKHMANGNTRYTFEFERGSVPKVEAGKAYRVQIVEEKP